MEDSFALSSNNMDELDSLHQELNRRKNEMQLVSDGLWSQIQSLWDRLEIDDGERMYLKDICPGIRPSHIQTLRQVYNLLAISLFKNISFR